jgi:hypothetical protein
MPFDEEPLLEFIHRIPWEWGAWRELSAVLKLSRSELGDATGLVMAFDYNLIGPDSHKPDVDYAKDCIRRYDNPEKNLGAPRHPGEHKCEPMREHIDIISGRRGRRVGVKAMNAVK